MDINKSPVCKTEMLEKPTKKKRDNGAFSLRPEGAENIPLGSQVSDLCF